jgi:hypothetical protein
MMVIVEKLVEWKVAGQTEVLGENLPQRHFVHHKDQTFSTHCYKDYLRIFSKFNRNVIYDVQCDILSKCDASHMNARATWSNGKTVKVNSCGTVVFRATPDIFQVVLEM